VSKLKVWGVTVLPSSHTRHSILILILLAVYLFKDLLMFLAARTELPGAYIGEM